MRNVLEAFCIKITWIIILCIILFDVLFLFMFHPNSNLKDLKS